MRNARANSKKAGILVGPCPPHYPTPGGSIVRSWLIAKDSSADLQLYSAAAFTGLLLVLQFLHRLGSGLDERHDALIRRNKYIYS